MGREKERSYTPQLYSLRWLMLFLFCLLSFSNGAQWSNFATISDITKYHYNVSSFAVNWLSMIYLVVYVVFAFLSILILDKFGLRNNLIVGASLNALGAIMKCFAISRTRYTLLMCAQTLAAFGQCFILGIPAQISADWFGKDERAVITSVGVFANQVGGAVSFALSPVLVPNNTTIVETKSGFFTLFISQGTFCSLILILIILVFKEKPPTPPSFSQVNKCSLEGPTLGRFCITISELIRRHSYFLLAIGYGLYVSITYALATLINDIIQSGYPGQNVFIGQLVFVYIISGLPGTILTGIWLEKNKTYKYTMVTATVLTTVIYTIFTLIYSQQIKNHFLYFVIFGLLGFTGAAVIPVGFEYAAELTYPVHEGISSGLLNCSAQILGFLLITLGTYLISLERIGIEILNWSFTGVLALSSILVIFIKTETRRSIADRYKTIIS